jgi:general secretion pathway protein E
LRILVIHIKLIALILARHVFGREFLFHVQGGAVLVVALADLLVNKGLVSDADVARAGLIAEQAGTRFASALARLGMISEGELAQSIGEASELPVIGRSDFPVNRPDIAGLNPRFLSRHNVLPLEMTEGHLRLAMADPSNEEALAALAFASGAREVTAVVASFSDIEEVIAADQFETGDTALEADWMSTDAGDDLERLTDGDSDAPVIRLVQRLLTNAVNRRASDVHIEPMARHVAVRYRIDGRLIEIERHGDALGGPIASRIKVMAGMDIAETRLPQDGRLQLTVRGRSVDVRVSTSPIANGESIVMRLLGRSEVPLDLEQLGLPETALNRLKAALDRPHGIILLTGPTGSGKTTTLYAAINRLRRPDVKILTVEDPVEVLLEGVNQVQVRPDIDLTYAATLRAFLRQDPDILMIGEIRDQETAEIAMRAALTGHLVLSTLHTNSAIGAFTRLADIGIEPYLTASTVIATIAQRLIRSLCTACRTARPPFTHELALFTTTGITAPATVYEPGACSTCGQTGYRGRIPLIEIIEVDERLREAVRARATDDLVDERPRAETLLGHGLALVAAGKTDLAEVERAVSLV